MQAHGTVGRFMTVTPAGTYSIGGGEVDTQTASAGAQEKDEDVGATLKV